MDALRRVRLLVALILATMLLDVAATPMLGGTPPSLRWSPPSSGSTYDFGTVAADARIQQRFSLTNSGGTASAVLVVTLTGSQAFGIVADGCTAISVGPKKSCVVTVEFSPGSSSAVQSATLRAVGHKPDTTATVNLTGRGVAGAFSGNVTPVKNTASAVSQDIGPDGGSITAGGMTLTVPAHALHDIQHITMTPVTAVGGSPFAQLIGAVDLQPQGLHFLRPATLAIPRPAGVTDKQIVGFGYSGAGSSFHLVPGLFTPSTIFLKIAHFTGSGISLATITEVQTALSYEPTRAEERAQQLIEAAEFAGAQDGTQHLADIKAALIYWYDHSIRIGFDSVGDSLDFLELAIGEWLSWEGDVQRFPDFDIDPDITGFQASARAKATEDTAHVADITLSLCTGLGADVWAPIRVLNRLSGELSELPLPIETKLARDGRSLPTVDQLNRSCAHVVIEGITHEPVLAASRTNAYAIDAGVAFWAAASPNHSIPLTLTVVDAGTELVAPTDTSTGHLATTVRPVGSGNHLLAVTADLAGMANDNFFATLSARSDDVVPVRSRVIVTVDANPVDSGAQTTVRVKTAGDGMAGATVTLSTTSGSVGASVTTDAAGDAATSFSAPADGTTSATITADFGDAENIVIVTIRTNPKVSITPSSATLLTGGQKQFSAGVTDAPDNLINWSATGGSITSTGLYTAGQTGGTFKVRATNPTTGAFAEATVAVTSYGRIVITYWQQWGQTQADAGAPGADNSTSNDFKETDPAGTQSGSYSVVTSGLAAASAVDPNPPGFASVSAGGSGVGTVNVDGEREFDAVGDTSTQCASSQSGSAHAAATAKSYFVVRFTVFDRAVPFLSTMAETFAHTGTGTSLTRMRLASLTLRRDVFSVSSGDGGARTFSLLLSPGEYSFTIEDLQGCGNGSSGSTAAHYSLFMGPDAVVP